MVSPNLATKKIPTGSEEFNNNAKKLFQAIYNDQNAPEDHDDEVARLQVSDLISKMSFFYEKIRNAVDYDEEHLLRKNAIYRILKRQIIIEGILKEQTTENLSRHLLVELIRASYLPNNSLPETKVGEVAAIMDKYLRLRHACVNSLEAKISLQSDIKKTKDNIQERNHISNWLLSLAACEIEESLLKGQTKVAMINVMFDTLQRIIKLPPELKYEQDLDIQVYLSISRTYARFDEDMLSLVLFKYYNHDWTDEKKDPMFAPSDERIAEIAKNIGVLRQAIKAQIEHPLKKQLDRLVKRYALYFTVLQDAISKDPAKTYNDFKQNPNSFVSLLRKVCNLKYKKAKSKLWRAALRSIIYIFLTKSIFVFLIEIPAIHLFNEPLNTLALAINVAFPATLLFLIVSSTRLPGDKNTDRIIDGVREISVIGSERQQPILLRNPKKRNRVLNFFFNLIYIFAFGVSLYFIIKVLSLIDFNWVSITIFLFFLAFVSFFSIIVTRGIKELMVVKRKDNIVTFFIDLFYMPIILAGKWLSRNVSKINIFIFIFDFIIEAPFKILVDVAEEWTKYVKERRDNVV